MSQFWTQPRQKYWQKLSGPRLLNFIIAVSAIAVSYEGMSQGVMGAVNVAPEYGVCTSSGPSHLSDGQADIGIVSNGLYER